MLLLMILQYFIASLKKILGFSKRRNVGFSTKKSLRTQCEQQIHHSDEKLGLCSCGSDQLGHRLWAFEEPDSFGCSSLDREILPESFHDLLNNADDIFDHLQTEKGLLAIEQRTGVNIFQPVPSDKVKEMVKKSAKIWPGKPDGLRTWRQDWDPYFRLPFIELAIENAALADKVSCIRFATAMHGRRKSSGVADMMIALDPLEEQQTCEYLETVAAEYANSLIHVCPVVTQRGHGGDVTRRLKRWCEENFIWIEESSAIPREEIWPIPFFQVDGDAWSFGFAIKSGGEVRLYREEIASTRWENGATKILILLELVVRWANEHYRPWFEEMFCKEHDGS